MKSESLNNFLIIYMIIYKMSIVFNVIITHVYGNIIKQPNIVLIIADDLGWGDVSLHGSDQIPTPNIDTLASDGIILNNFYVSPICSPSRSALLTGYHPIHTGQHHDPIFDPEPRGVPLRLKMLPEYLRNLGYSTVAIGKWHQGFYRSEYIPTERGFHSHFGFWTAKEDYYNRINEYNNFIGIDFRRNEKRANVSEYMGIYSTEMYTYEAIKTIMNHSESSNNNPLFLYMAFQAVHKGNRNDPFQAPQYYINRFKYIKDRNKRTYAAMVSALDDAIGEIVAALYHTQIINNTIIIFASDNGGPIMGKINYDDIYDGVASNWPLKGGKMTLWEGGIRGVSFIWSYYMKNRYISEHLMHIQDLMPTIYSAAGGNVKDMGSIDGMDLWWKIINNIQSSRRELLHNIDPIDNVWAIRRGDYKLISGSYKNGHYDYWYDPREIQTNSLKRQQKRLKKSLYSNCTVNKIFEKIGRNVTSVKRVILKCDETIYTKCDPIQSPCLFDIRKDPCEYDNIALENPQIVKELKCLLKKYNATAVPPDNKPEDERVNPALHGNYWDIWD